MPEAVAHGFRQLLRGYEMEGVQHIFEARGLQDEVETIECKQAELEEGEKEEEQETRPLASRLLGLLEQQRPTLGSRGTH